MGVVQGQLPCTLRSQAEGPGHRAGSARLTLLTSCPGPAFLPLWRAWPTRPLAWALTHPNSGIR